MGAQNVSQITAPHDFDTDLLVSHNVVRKDSLSHHANEEFLIFKTRAHH